MRTVTDEWILGCPAVRPRIGFRLGDRRGLRQGSGIACRRKGPIPGPVPGFGYPAVVVAGPGSWTGGGGTVIPGPGTKDRSPLRFGWTAARPGAVLCGVRSAPALSPRLRRPARTPAPAARRRNAPGRCRAKVFTSSRREPGSRSSSQVATDEDRWAACRTKSVATPGCSEAVAMECSSSEMDRRPAATFCCCLPAWSVRSSLACSNRSLALEFTSEATFATSDFAVSTTFIAESPACSATFPASSLMVSVVGMPRFWVCGG